VISQSVIKAFKLSYSKLFNLKARLLPELDSSFFCVTKLKRKDQLILALFFAKRQKVVSKTGKKTGDIEG